MTIPAYLWLKDDSGAAIRGSVDVAGREGRGLNHCVTLPTDDVTVISAGPVMYNVKSGYGERHNYLDLIELMYGENTCRY